MDGREVYAIEVIDIGNNGYDMEMVVKELVLWRWKDGGNVCVCVLSAKCKEHPLVEFFCLCERVCA